MGTSTSTASETKASKELGSRSESNFSDFEAVDKPPSPPSAKTMGATRSNQLGASTAPAPAPASLNSSGSNNNKANPNDLFTSGILVEMTEEEKALISKRRIVKASKKTRDQRPSSPVIISSSTLSPSNESDGNEKQRHDLSVSALGKTQESDAQLLQESLDAARQQRLLKLQSDQKNRRNKAIEDRRKHRKEASSVQANPFSRFLKAFSVESEFPAHKRAHEVDGEDSDIDAKRPKLNNEEDDDSRPSVGKVLEWLDDRLPEGWGFMAAAAVTTCLAITVTLRLVRGPSRSR